MENLVNLEIVPCDVNFKEFTKGTPDSACYDLTATRIVTTPGTAGREVKVYFGFKVQFDPKYVMLLQPRSGFSNKGWVMANTPGHVDADYRGEVYAVFQAIPKLNFEDATELSPFPYKEGDRAIQMRMDHVLQCKLNYKDPETELSTTERGVNGFGSTGNK